MPLLCLAELRDPVLFEECLHLHYTYALSVPEIASNYVNSLLGNLRFRACEKRLYRRNRSNWFAYATDRLSTAHFTHRDEIYFGLNKIERDCLNTALNRLTDRGFVERRGKPKQYEFRLIKAIN